MTLKGDSKADVAYQIGDVVRYGEFAYKMYNPEGVGIPPTVTRCWRRLNQELWDVVDMILDAVDSRITEDSIALKGENGDYLITVDDSGDTPELAVTEIEEGT